MFATIRQFFAEKNILEVDTPLLAQYSVTDPHMEVLSVDHPLGKGERYYLQTSPEYAMKRLLAAGSGPIYQMGKVFRKGEQSSRHNPEFTMLEWYRPGFDHQQMMDEVEVLVAELLSLPQPFARYSYQHIFQHYLGLCPHTSSCEQLRNKAQQLLDVQMHSDDKDDWLNVLLTEIIEPQLGINNPTFIYDYPATQAALAKLNPQQDYAVAQRFELYVKGVELANGYFELTDAAELKQRFQQDQQKRQQLNRPVIEMDVYLLAAMEQGLPECSGVALGVDRLLMLALGETSVSKIISFPAVIDVS